MDQKKYMVALVPAGLGLIGRLGKREAFYFTLMAGTAFFGLIRTLVLGAVLEPVWLGYYSVALTIASYGALIQGGLMSGLNRELPVRLGKGNEREAMELVGETTIALFIVPSLGLMVYYTALALMDFQDAHKKTAFLIAGLLAFSSPFFQMVLLRLRAEQRVLTLSSVQFVHALGVLALSVAAIEVAGYTGALFVIILLNLLGFAIVSKKNLKPASYRLFRLKDISYLARIGLPLMIAGVLVNLQMSMDRLFLIGEKTAAEIGIYQIGAIPLFFGVLMSGIIDQYVSPRLLFRFGEGKSLGYLFNSAFATSLILILVMLLLGPLLLLLSGWVIDRWMPVYRDSIPFISVFYLGAVFTSANISGVVMNAANRQTLILCVSAIVTSIGFMGYLIVSIRGMSMIWYAYVNVAVQILSFLIISATAYLLAKNSKRLLDWSTKA